MLQQTTVAAAIPYFERFVQHFPTLESLAAAHSDEVMRLWQGLGYYARARNLHACAQRILAEHGGQMPQSRSALEALPGIGRSTAAAICAQAWGQKEAILDANVKRVLVRHLGMREWPGSSAAHNTLWAAAEDRLPSTQLADYTQGLMDLGASVCTARQPQCAICPVAADCQAQDLGIAESLPARKPGRKKPKPRRHCELWLLRRADGALWLQKRPDEGIWGGLWCPPHSPFADQPSKSESSNVGTKLPALKHVFTHFELLIQPLLLDSGGVQDGDVHSAVQVDTQAPGMWVSPEEMHRYGLPTPVRKILATLPA